MAPICRMHRDTVWDALNFLVEHQLLSRTKRTGQTTIFSVAPIHKWRNAHPAENKGHKVYPSEVNPKEGVPPTEGDRDGKGKIYFDGGWQYGREIRAFIGECEKALFPLTSDESLESGNYRDSDGGLLPKYRERRDKLKEKLRRAEHALLGIGGPNTQN